MPCPQRQRVKVLLADVDRNSRHIANGGGVRGSFGALGGRPSPAIHDLGNAPRAVLIGTGKSYLIQRRSTRNNSHPQ